MKIKKAENLTNVQKKRIKLSKNKQSCGKKTRQTHEV